jgi:tetratricopeptide (TPR) repeat protein
VSESRGDLKAAEDDLNKAIAVAPKSPLGYTRMGQLLGAEKRFSEAEKEFQRALQADPNDIEAVRGLATAYVVEKRSGDAVAYVRSLLAKAPDNLNYNLLLGQLLAGEKDYRGAEGALLKAADLSKNNSAVLYLLGHVQAAGGAKDRAIASYERAIQANPRDAQAYVMLGLLEEAQGNWQRAQELYRKALQVQPDSPQAANNLAYVMLQHGGNLDVALSLAQTARQALPDSPGVADTLAVACYKKGNYNLAIDLLKEALTRTPNSADFSYHLALVYQKTDDRARAVEYLQRALKIDPNYAKAHEIPQDLIALSKG